MTKLTRENITTLKPKYIKEDTIDIITYYNKAKDVTELWFDLEQLGSLKIPVENTYENIYIDNNYLKIQLNIGMPFTMCGDEETPNESAKIDYMTYEEAMKQFNLQNNEN